MITHAASGAPGFGNLPLSHLIVIPSFTLGTVEATVLNHVRFRQTNVVPGATVGKLATPLNFDQQSLSRKMKTYLPFGFHRTDP